MLPPLNVTVQFSRVISCLREANSQRPREATVVAVKALDRLRVLTDTVPKELPGNLLKDCKSEEY